MQYSYQFTMKNFRIEVLTTEKFLNHTNDEKQHIEKVIPVVYKPGKNGRSSAFAGFQIVWKSPHY